MDALINLLAGKLGIDPVLVPLYLGVLVAVANLLGKSIPVSATGALGIVRKVALVIGLYVPQRITPNVTTKNVAEAVAAEVPDSAIKHSANRLPNAVETGIAAGVVARAIVDAAQHKTPGREYVPGESPEEGSIVPDEFRTDGPFQRQKGK